MQIAAEITVNSIAVRALGFEVGRTPGQVLAEWSVSVGEYESQYDPPDVGSDSPVDISVTVLGRDYPLMENGRLASVSDTLGGEGMRTQLSGMDRSWMLLEKGPARDTVFIPKWIVVEVYPLGLKIVTLSGESVLGIPPETRIDTPAPNIAISTGVGTMTEMKTEADWLAQLDTVCSPLQAFNDVYARATLPEFVILGGTGGLKHRTYLDAEEEEEDSCANAFIQGRRITGGVNRATINSLVELIAKKAGFTKVVNNCPDMTMFEPFTVSAGTTWFQAIRTLVGPWNPEIFVDGTVLYIIDVEAADLNGFSGIGLGFKISGDTVKVLSRQTSRLPPYNGVNVLGPLRAALEALREFSRGPAAFSAPVDGEDDCIPPRQSSGFSCAREGLPPGYKVEAPSKSERVMEYDRGDGGIPEVTIGPEMPYNVEVSRTFSNGASTYGLPWSGEEAVHWDLLTIRKLYFADPAMGRIQLRYVERKVHGQQGTYSKQTTRIIQGRFGNSPCQVVSEEYSRAQLPHMLFPQLILTRRSITNYSANLNIEGTFDSTTDEYMLTIFTVGTDGNFYKPIPYHEAAHAGAIDTSSLSLDSYKLAHYSRTTESYQVIDKYFAQKDTCTVYSFGGQPAHGDVEIFMYRDPRSGGSYGEAPRQRHCFGVNEDGSLIKIILAIGAATEEQAKLIADRAKRRGGARQVRMDVEIPTFLPGVRVGTGIEILGTSFRLLNAENNAMTTTSRLSGKFFINGFRYVCAPVGQGAYRLHTRLSLRSQF